MSLKKKAAQIDLGKLVAGATATTSPLAGGVAPGAGMTAIGMHAETVYRDRKIAEENKSLTHEVEGLKGRLAEFEGAELAKKLDPKLVLPSKWANRAKASFQSKEFDALKAEIESAGGNVQPIKVRPIAPEQGRAGQGAFEIVFGHRRHRACLELGLDVLCTIEELDDANLFAQMDRENRQRADLRPFEQGVMYARALDDGLFPSMRKMTEALGVDVGNASKAISLARLPELVLSAFQSPLDLQQAWASVLNEALQKNPDVVLARAKDLAALPAKPSALEVFKTLTAESVVSNNTSGSTKTSVVKGAGLSTGEFEFNSKTGIFKIKLKGLSDSQREDMEAAVKKILG